jgi:hypothetical protein
MERVTLSGLTRANSMENLFKTIFKAKALISGPTVAPSKACGKTIKWTDMAFSCGPTAVAMKANTKTIKSLERVSSTGLMVEFTTANGSMVSNTAKALTSSQTVSRSADAGPRAKEFHGSTEGRDSYFYFRWSLNLKAVLSNSN